MPGSPLGPLFLTVALDLVGFGMVVPLLPLYAEQMAGSGHAIAWLLSSYSLMQFVFAPVWGRLSDRIGRRPVLLASIFANAACLLAFALARSYWQLLAARVGAGVCTANVAVASAYVADVTDLRGRARGMGLIGAAFGLGFVLGPFFASELVRFGLTAPAFTACGLALVNGLWAWRVLPESLPSSARAALMAKRSAGAVRRWQLLSARPALWRLYALIFLQVGGFAMMELTLALFCGRRFGLTAAGTGRLLAFVGVVMVAVQGAGVGPVLRRIGESRAVPLALAGLAAALAALPSLAGLGAGIPGLLLAMAWLAACQGLVAASLSTLVSKAAPAAEQGAALGLSQSASALARTAGPAAAGLLLDARGIDAPLLGAALVVAFAVVVAWIGRGTAAEQKEPSWANPSRCD